MDDLVKNYMIERSQPLAQLRENGLRNMAQVKDVLRSIANVGVSIGISPRDTVLSEMNHTEINKIINDYLLRVREGDAGARCPHPPPFLVIGEYSPQHRWHYHGAIAVKEMKTLDRIKKYIQRKIGRCVTAQISYVESYVDYCTKTYKDDSPLKVYSIFNDDCYVSNLKVKRVGEAANTECLAEPARKKGTVTEDN